MSRPHRLATIALAGTGAVLLLLGTASTAEAAGGATVRTEGGPLKIRSLPSLAGAILATLPNRTPLTIACQQAGQQITGSARTTTAWDKLSDGRYVSDAYVARTGAPPPACAPPSWVRPASAPFWGGFRTPLRPTHDGVDLGALRNSPVFAVAAGTVVTAECNVSPTHVCDVDGSPAVAGCGWYVEIRHLDNTVTRYCHLVRRPLVNVGQRVAIGQVLGYAGMSGNAGAPHLHFEVHIGYPAIPQNAVDPVPFMAAHGAAIR
jgi:murein DD-endopeptidase MepM/ murein hydrolase activator NlpD